MPNYHNAECTIGDNIVVNILGVGGGAVKIGIDAPREVTILRMEVWEQIERKNIDTAAKDISDITEAVALFKKKLPGK